MLGSLETPCRQYFVEEWVGSTTLRDLLHAERILSVNQKLDLVKQIAAGMEYLHNAGIVHSHLVRTFCFLRNLCNLVHSVHLDYHPRTSQNLPNP